MTDRPQSAAQEDLEDAAQPLEAAQLAVVPFGQDLGSALERTALEDQPEVPPQFGLEADSCEQVNPLISQQADHGGDKVRLSPHWGREQEGLEPTSLLSASSSTRGTPEVTSRPP